MNHTHAGSGNIYLPEGQLLGLPRNREMTSSLVQLEKAMCAGTILEGYALLCDNELNLHIDLPSIPNAVAVIPPCEAVYTVDRTPVKDIAILTRVGKAVCFKVTDIRMENGVPFLTLSRRAAQAECMTHYLSTLTPGDIIPARVTHMENFGAFVDIGCGISSLMTVDCISVSRISHPKDRLHNGQLIKAVIKSIEQRDNGLPGRIFVSLRELLGTWAENAARFHAGQTVAGIIRSVEDYGIFVELTPNLAGLAELKEEPGGASDHQKALRAHIGHRATVYIKSLISERMKVKLVLIDTFADEHLSPPPLTYFLPSDGSLHLSRWVYSPSSASKVIESIFDTSSSI